MTKICPSCKQLADHKYEGMQQGLPVHENGKLYLYDVPLYTCELCGSTWVDINGKTNRQEVK